MEKIAFALDVVDDWPPVAVEHVWCDKEADAYVLRNAPFFIHGLAYGDKFTAQPDPVNGCVFEFTVVSESGNSLVWALDAEDRKFGAVKKELIELGCSVEGFPAFGLHSIDIPPSIDHAILHAAIESIEARGYALAFPVWRHECNDA